MSTTDHSADDVTSKWAEDSPLCDESGQVPLVVYSPVTSDLLSPIPSTPEPSLAPSRDAQLRWLQRCLPIIAQPTHDITHGHGLCAVFVSFEGSECRMSHIYEGESSYHRGVPTSFNRFGTWLYRSFNYFSYGRTADIDDLTFKGISFDPDASDLWQSIHTSDHCGNQTWSQGSKTDFCTFYSLMHHYNADVARSELELASPAEVVKALEQGANVHEPLHFHDWKKGHNLYSASVTEEKAPGAWFQRPILYLNTQNHLWGQRDLNPRLSKRMWYNYPVFFGNRADAEVYAQKHVPVKSNFFRPLPRLWNRRPS